MNLSAYLITWNVGSKSDSLILKALLDFVTKYNPVGIAVQEVADRSEVLRTFCKQTGYRVVRFHEGQHSSAVAILVRGDLPDEGVGSFLMTPKSFVGRQVAGSRDDGWTKPKWTVYGKTSFWDLKWVIASTHLTPSHQVPAARSLARVQVATIAMWMRLRRRIVLLGGDFNEPVDSHFGTLGPLKSLGTAFTASSFNTRAIDMWWVVMRLFNQHRITVEVEALDGYPSDHRPVLLTMTKTMSHVCPTCFLEHDAP
jgi:hypothetical protein